MPTASGSPSPELDQSQHKFLDSVLEFIYLDINTSSHTEVVRAHTKSTERSLLITLLLILSAPQISWGQTLSANSGINPGDTYVVFDMVVSGQASVNLSAPLYNPATNNGSGAAVSSDDGNHVVFISIADNLLPFPYLASAVYVRMTCKNAAPDCVPTTYLLSFDSSTGIQGNSSYSDWPAITPDGRYAVFVSNAPNWPGALQSKGNNQVWLARVR